MQTAEQVKKTLGLNLEQQCKEPEPDDKWIQFEKERIERYNLEEGNKTDFDCNICKNKGVIAVLSDYGTMVLRECGCMKQRKSIKAAKKSGAWNLMQRHTFDNFIVKTDWQKELKAKAMKYCAQEEKGWLFAGGQTGAGKTHLCTAVFRRFFKSPVNGVYCMWRSEIRKLLGSGFAGFDESENRIEELKTCDVLYIDDLFKTDDNAKPERREIELAFEILNSRYNTEKPTIISSERTLRDIANLNEAIAGRIAERCGENILSIDKDLNKNYRLGEI